MSRTTDLFAALDRLSAVGRQQLLLRAACPVGALLFIVVLAAEGAPFHLLLYPAVLLLALGAALAPDSSVPLFLLLALGGLWAISVPRTLDGWALLAALDLLAVHLSATLASYGPPALVLERDVLACWGRRYAALAAVTALTWLMATAIAGLDLPDSGWSLALALVVLLGWVALATSRLVLRTADSRA